MLVVVVLLLLLKAGESRIFLLVRHFGRYKHTIILSAGNIFRALCVVVGRSVGRSVVSLWSFSIRCTAEDTYIYLSIYGANHLRRHTTTIVLVVLWFPCSCRVLGVAISVEEEAAAAAAVKGFH